MNPLDQLQDISLPAQIHNYPIAPGYWLALILAIVIMVLFIRAFKRHLANNKAKKKALKQLKKIELKVAEYNQVSQLDQASFNQHLNDLLILLKWASLQYFNRDKVAALYGEQFKTFLIESLPAKHHHLFTEQCNELFSIAYQKQKKQSNDDYFQLLTSYTSATRLWLSQALPAKKIKASLNQECATNNSVSETEAKL